MNKYLLFALGITGAACNIPSDITIKAPCKAVTKIYSHPDPATGTQVQDSVVVVVDPTACPK